MRSRIARSISRERSRSRAVSSARDLCPDPGAGGLLALVTASLTFPPAPSPQHRPELAHLAALGRKGGGSAVLAFADVAAVDQKALLAAFERKGEFRGRGVRDPFEGVADAAVDRVGAAVQDDMDLAVK